MHEAALHEAAVHGAGGGVGGVARVEGLGAVGLAQLADLLGHTNLTLKRVVDLREAVSSTPTSTPAGSPNAST